jgi:hypothetical protein
MDNASGVQFFVHQKSLGPPGDVHSWIFREILLLIGVYVRFAMILQVPVAFGACFPVLTLERQGMSSGSPLKITQTCQLRAFGSRGFLMEPLDTPSTSLYTFQSSLTPQSHGIRLVSAMYIQVFRSLIRRLSVNSRCLTWLAPHATFGVFNDTFLPSTPIVLMTMDTLSTQPGGCT